MTLRTFGVTPAQFLTGLALDQTTGQVELRRHPGASVVLDQENRGEFAFAMRQSYRGLQAMVGGQQVGEWFVKIQSNGEIDFAKVRDRQKRNLALLAFDEGVFLDEDRQGLSFTRCRSSLCQRTNILPYVAGTDPSHFMLRFYKEAPSFLYSASFHTRPDVSILDEEDSECFFELNERYEVPGIGPKDLAVSLEGGLAKHLNAEHFILSAMAMVSQLGLCFSGNGQKATFGHKVRAHNNFTSFLAIFPGEYFPATEYYSDKRRFDEMMKSLNSSQRRLKSDHHNMQVVFDFDSTTITFKVCKNFKNKSKNPWSLVVEVQRNNDYENKAPRRLDFAKLESWLAKLAQTHKVPKRALALY